MNAPSKVGSMLSVESDPVREGLWEWAVHILRADEWAGVRTRNLVQDILTQCFSAPTYWNVRLAEALLEDEGVPDREQWRAVLRAARSDGEEMEVDVEEIDEALPVGAGKEKVQGKIMGPRKVMGMWKARPIGWVPVGWEEDE
jgi:ribosomal biogenesis protein LAS1